MDTNEAENIQKKKNKKDDTKKVHNSEFPSNQDGLTTHTKSGTNISEDHEEDLPNNVESKKDFLTVSSIDDNIASKRHSTESIENVVPSIVQKKGFCSLTLEEQETVCNNFIDLHKQILRKNLGCFRTSKIKQNFINHLFFEPISLRVIQKNLENTKFRFCKDTFQIPNTLNLIGNIILEKEFNQKGLFRVPTTKQRMRTATALLYDIIEKRVNLERGKELFDKNFDLIDCCELYKELLRSFNSAIIPFSFVQTILKISKMEDREEKIICTKAIFYALPNINRCVLESNIFMCYKIVQKTGEMENKTEQLDLDGICTIMMPNLFLEPDQNIPIEVILELVEFCKFLFKNFQEIYTVEE